MKWSLFVAWAFTACAKPNYQNLKENPQTLSTPPCEVSFYEKKCSLFLAVENICLDIEWEKFQIGNQKGSFFICSYNRTTGGSQNVSVRPFVELWMPSMNHGSSPTRTQESITSGVYYVENVYFIMSGDWEIRVQIKEGSTIKDQAILPITVQKK